MCLLLLIALTAKAQKENLETLFDIHHILGYLVAGLLISVFVTLFLNRIIYFREQQDIKKSKRLNEQLSMLLSSNKLEAWTYDVNNDLYKKVSNEGKNDITYTPFEFSQFYDRHDFANLLTIISDVNKGASTTGSIIVRSAPPKEGDDTPQRLYNMTVSVLRHDRQNVPTVILGTQKDITDEQTHTEKIKKLALRYHTVFNSSLIDMIYYNEEGIMTDINDKACETFGIKDRQAALRRKIKFNDIPSYRNFDINSFEQTHLSSITNITNVKKYDERVPEITIGGEMFYEAVVGPIRNKQNKLLGVIAAGRDISEMVNSNHHQKAASQLLIKTTKDIQQYIQNINYSLKVSEMRLMNYHPDTHIMEISSDLNRTQYILPQLRAALLIHQDDRSKAERLFCRMDRKHKGDFSETFRTIFRDKKGRNVYLFFNVMPISDEKGNITHYFGICRNETEMVYTEKKLKEETEKAQEEEKLKDTFLLNMSHELRTPLNAVIGFAELFNMEHSAEDEPIFAEEIKKNTGILLQLINDILFLSRIDAHMIEYNYQENDFALLFDGWCYMGWSTLFPNVKTSIENPYSSLIVKIDQQNLGMIIQKLCLYSGLLTKEGMVRAKYEYHHGELTITIEDTSKGMTPEEIQNAFNRFMHKEGENDGSGLDLPIVKELTEQMNGRIELQSEPGKGNTFFINIPCEMISMEKKQQF